VAPNAVNPFCNRNSHRILRPIEKMGGFGRNEIWETCGNGPPTGLTALCGTWQNVQLIQASRPSRMVAKNTAWEAAAARPGRLP
jgi:hypothetical protein